MKDNQTLYSQLVHLMIDKIQREKKPNDKLPSERELVDRYKVSRTTIRKALSTLEMMGYVYRQHGSGTFVSYRMQPSMDLASSYSFTNQMKSLGLHPRSDILEFSHLHADGRLANKLGVNHGDDIIKIKRLRIADEIPMMLERTYLPDYIFHKITLEQLQKQPLYTTFNKDFHIRIQYADESFFAGIVSERDKDLLKVPVGSPCLSLTRTTVDIEGKIIEYTLSVARGDKFIYHMRHRVAPD